MSTTSPVHLPNSYTASGNVRFCFAHQSQRPIDGGCEIGAARWICAACWTRRKFRPSASAQLQSGSTLFGLLMGIVLGLGLGGATAVTVSKVPVPFVARDISRDSVDDRNEALRNRGWNPNSPLQSSAPSSTAAPVLPPEPVLALGLDLTDDERDEDPRDQYQYFVQGEPFVLRADAEDFRAQILSTGQDARVVKRDGRFFTRMGPYQSRVTAEGLKRDLDAVGCNCSLVRVQD